MTLEGFKYIFWWEWAHRFLGRVIGLTGAPGAGKGAREWSHGEEEGR